MIYIVGLGPGHRYYIMPKALETMKKSDIIIGFKRAIDSLDFINNKKIYINKLSDIDKFIESKENGNKEIQINKNISIVASGDPTFYGITNYIKSKTALEIEVIPGLSSFQYLTCKLKIPWNNAHLGSLHGRNEEFLEQINNNQLSIWLTDKENNPSVLCKILYEAKIKCKVAIGENLSYEDEIISEGIPKDFINKNYSSLSIFIVYKVNK
ncbi:putative cobalt-precorrin-6Y C(5)-methyltransferase [Clostridium puniceum]|uniref:Putative cobalt-precorrin-6Y C(5)-methyltransferase n=1 Tax=Clostridium puniceum TaxID=29367 RepID=A0A1S8TE52_9CLOT|nr:precorrin-6y C5,15-methyltransferase (decarboxylating) subunit CbiE [Clostridium puniceum]OOM75675.1 putative cobalt-precorrin-6Y C(5)-methyltransferase [Clostridium puniceum]